MQLFYRICCAFVAMGLFGSLRNNERWEIHFMFAGALAIGWWLIAALKYPEYAQRVFVGDKYWQASAGKKIYLRYFVLFYVLSLVIGWALDIKELSGFGLLNLIIGAALSRYFHRKQMKLKVVDARWKRVQTTGSPRHMYFPETKPTVPVPSSEEPVTIEPTPSHQHVQPVEDLSDDPVAERAVGKAKRKPATHKTSEPEKPKAKALSVTVVHYHAPTEDGQLPLQGHDQPFWDDFLRLRFNSTETHAELTLSYDHSSLSVRPYDIVVAKDGPLRHFMTCEGEGSHLTQARPGRMRLSATGDAWVVEEKIYVQLS